MNKALTLLNLLFSKLFSVKQRLIKNITIKFQANQKKLENVAKLTLLIKL
jgi:hypothetical protein